MAYKLLSFAIVAVLGVFFLTLYGVGGDAQGFDPPYAPGSLDPSFNGTGIDNKLKQKTGSTSKYFLQDHLGSTVGLADASGAITESNSYDSFGNASNSSFSSRYQFTGREFDSFTGLQYNRARWYNPQIGRFISEDPIGFRGGDVNLYGYVRNNPVNYFDPLGLCRIGDPACNYLRDPFSPYHWVGNGLSNSLSDLLALDAVANWSWTAADHNRSSGERVGAGAKLGGLAAVQVLGGYVLGKVFGWAGRAITGRFVGAGAGEVIGGTIGPACETAANNISGALNKTSNIILRDGYYEANGFKVSELYYNELWNTGRPAPFLVAPEVLDGATTVTADVIKPGFFRYEFGGLEMVYNPTTGEIWHLQPIP